MPPFQGQLQGQGELQAQLEAQLQAQGQAELQAQGQGQGQGEHQSQGQNQSQWGASAAGAFSESVGLNANGNLNGNGNLNANGNLNVDENINHNVNVNHNVVDVGVYVDVAASITPPDDSDVIDIDSIDIPDLDGQLFINPDSVVQRLEDESGNDIAFNADQINNLIDNDCASGSVSSSVYAGASGESGSGGWNSADGNVGSLFSQVASATGGGGNGIGDVSADIGGDAQTVSDLATSSADAAASNEAFTQNIVLGSNLQFNQMELNIDNDAG